MQGHRLLVLMKQTGFTKLNNEYEMTDFSGQWDTYCANLKHKTNNINVMIKRCVFWAITTMTLGSLVPIMRHIFRVIAPALSDRIFCVPSARTDIRYLWWCNLGLGHNADFFKLSETIMKWRPRKTVTISVVSCSCFSVISLVILILVDSFIL